MKKIDRVILAVIALALAVIALNPWVAPGYVSAQRGTMDVNIWEIDGRRINLPRVEGNLPGIPVIILNK